jgi:nucleotide-binding universal stress UspA family protein
VIAQHEVPERQHWPRGPKLAIKPELRHAPDLYSRKAPIVAAVEPQTARTTAEVAARLAHNLGAPLVFVTVRPRPSAMRGDPYYQRRLTRDLFRGRKTLDTALAAASGYGVMPYGEILEGDAATRIVDFARAQDARLVVVGRRRRRFWPSVSRRVIRASRQPVVVA